MGVQDAIDTRKIAQKIKSVMPKIQEGFFNERALLKLAEKRVKWAGSHTHFDWRVRYVPTDEEPDWGGGELGIRSFKEQKVANELILPYCYLEKTWGVGNRTIEANKNASTNKNFDVIKENLQLAQIFMYDKYGPSIYNPNLTSEDPVGLWAAVGQAHEASDIAIIGAGQTYAGKTLNTAASTTAGDLLVRNGNDKNSRGWDEKQFAPLVGDCDEIADRAGITGSSVKWSVGAIQILDYMANTMSITASISGTGTRIKPDIALMNTTPFMTLKALVTKGQGTGYQVPLGRKELVFAGFANLVVDSLTCIKDTDVPIDTDHGGGGSGEEIVFVLDSNQFSICTTHRKSEGIIKSEYDPDIAMVSGVVGALTANIAFVLSSPTAVGAILGCND